MEDSLIEAAVLSTSIETEYEAEPVIVSGEFTDYRMSANRTMDINIKVAVLSVTHEPRNEDTKLLLDGVPCKYSE
jgi:hypothetical protein